MRLNGMATELGINFETKNMLKSRNHLAVSRFFRTFAVQNKKRLKRNMVKLNNSDEYESIGTIKLTKEKFPKAFKAKV